MDTQCSVMSHHVSSKQNGIDKSYHILCDIMTNDNYRIGCTLNSATFLDKQIEKIEYFL